MSNEFDVISDITSSDKGRLVFMQLRMEEFAALWADFVRIGGDLSDPTVRQVINALPTESLHDWVRARRP